MGKDSATLRRSTKHTGMVGAFMFFALTGLRGTLPFVLQTPRKVRKAQLFTKVMHYKNGTPHQGEGEKARRRRQMAAGRLVFHTYGETR